MWQARSACLVHGFDWRSSRRLWLNIPDVTMYRFNASTLQHFNAF
jgi:hypothetical protein